MLTLLRHIIDGSLNCEKISSLNNREKNHYGNDILPNIYERSIYLQQDFIEGFTQ